MMWSNIDLGNRIKMPFLLRSPDAAPRVGFEIIAFLFIPVQSRYSSYVMTVEACNLRSQSFLSNVCVSNRIVFDIFDDFFRISRSVDYYSGLLSVAFLSWMG
jgi:hypothetical protein